MKLQGRHAFITGASRGFGLAVAHALLAEGAHITMCGRDPVALREAEANLRAQGGRVLARVADVTDPEALADLVAESEAAFGPMDILVANAGVYGPKGAIQDVDWHEWTDAISINLLGTVLTCRCAIPSIRRGDPHRRGKIILLSGGGATKPLPNLSAYAASKAGVVRFGETLAEELRPLNIDVNAVAPGALNTRLLDEVLAAGPEQVGPEFYQQSVKQKQEGGTPLAVGAELCVFLASDASDGISGKLISAVWDPWATLPEHASDLATTDIYTLRRIVPGDRGLEWS